MTESLIFRHRRDQFAKHNNALAHVDSRRLIIRVKNLWNRCPRSPMSNTLHVGSD